MSSLKLSDSVNFKNAYYIKLGGGGIWEEDSIGTGKLRFGWQYQTLRDINKRRWDAIEAQMRAGTDNQGLAMRALHGLQMITESDRDDVWITFHNSKL
jgi:hypothetical protein